MKESQSGILYICATPIGNLEDITLRVLNLLKRADIIVCEDTRRTKKLLNYYDIKPLRLISYHLHSSPKRKRELLDLLTQGKDLFLLSDAGTPGIADPGPELVNVARENGIKATVLPGPSAVTSALALSGFSGDRFVFLGFLDRLSKKERTGLLKENKNGDTLVMFESPYKIKETLKEIKDIMEECEVVLLRELTKKFEEVLTGKPEELIAHFDEIEPRGEFTIVIRPNKTEKTNAFDKKELREMLTLLNQGGIPGKYAVKAVSVLMNIPRNQAYKIQLEIDKNKGS